MIKDVLPIAGPYHIWRCPLLGPSVPNFMWRFRGCKSINLFLIKKKYEPFNILIS
ncbi:hypothetical protein AKJ16_DCAP04472 [Drosera capensis]